MASSFYWYDLETSGTDPKWDRIVQFAGVRTDEALEVVGDEYCTYVHLPDDVLPSPQASLVTGITPQRTHAEGVSETQALVRINEIFSAPNTCVVGYNSLRFDDEFMRYGLYRNMLDPYAREFRQGNSRWDLIDLVRATGALRRDGIEWPEDEDGLPVYRLEVLTAANGIAHGHAHDAMSDVHATIGMARLIKKAQPKLFDYYLGLRQKKAVRNLLEPYGARMCVHVSAMYPRTRSGVGLVTSLTRHPTNSNSVIVVDLGADIEPVLALSAEELAKSLFEPGAAERPPLKEIRLNRCPFVAPMEVLNEENVDRLQIDMATVKARARRIKQPGVADKVARAYALTKHASNSDPDASLYDGFLQDDDRSRCDALHEGLKIGRWQDLDYRDKRLDTLARRMKARSFPAMLEAGEIDDWKAFVRSKLEGDGDWLSLPAFEASLNEMLAGDVSAEAHNVLSHLVAHAQDLRMRYQL